MDFSKALGAEFRAVKELTHCGEAARAVIASRSYSTDIDDLWHSVTDAERIARWFSPISGDLKLGGRYQLEGNAGGEITRCDGPTALDVTWEFAGNVSWVRVRLEEKGEETLLHLEHVMPQDEAGETHWAQYGPGATGVGWDLGFLGMQLYLDEHRKIVDQDVVNAWMASEPGKQFIHDCARLWGAAHLQSGADQPTADTMAAETAKAYTGE